MPTEQQIRDNIARFKQAVNQTRGNLREARKLYKNGKKECSDRVCTRQDAGTVALQQDGRVVGYMETSIPVDSKICSTGTDRAIQAALSAVVADCGSKMVTSAPAALEAISNNVRKVGSSCSCVQGLFSKNCPPFKAELFKVAETSDAMVSKAATCVLNGLEQARSSQFNYASTIGVGLAAVALVCFCAYMLCCTSEGEKCMSNATSCFDDNNNNNQRQQPAVVMTGVPVSTTASYPQPSI